MAPPRTRFISENETCIIKDDVFPFKSFGFATSKEVIAIRHPQFTGIIQELPDAVPFTAPEQLERMSARKLNLRLGANESPFGVSPLAQEAMRESIQEAMWYGDPESYDLRQELTSRFGFAMRNTVVGSGIDELLGLIVRVFMDAGDTVVASKGAYPTFLYHVAGFGGCQQLVPYLHYFNDLDGLAAQAQQSQPKIVYLSNPDNPTGTYYRADEIQTFLDALPDGCLLVLDEAYIEFAPEDIMLPHDHPDPRLIRLRTFSKVYGLAGARIGYAVAHADIIDAINKTRNHFGVNRMAQRAALASLQDESFLNDVVVKTALGRQDYYNLARELGYAAVESATNFVCVDVGDAENARRLVDGMWDMGIFIRMPGTPPLDRCIRLTVGTPQQRAQLAAALRKLQ